MPQQFAVAGRGVDLFHEMRLVMFAGPVVVAVAAVVGFGDGAQCPAAQVNGVSIAREREFRRLDACLCGGVLQSVGRTAVFLERNEWRATLAVGPGAGSAGS
jgi:hypothetical protein